MILRPYQEVIAPQVFDYMISNPGRNPCIAIPTGGGKTIIAADIIKHALEKWPKTKILVVSHVKEILEQDYDALTAYLNIPVGLYSSGLKSRTFEQVTVAGIQSIYRQIDLFKNIDFVIVDEAHLIPIKGLGMYKTFLNGIGEHRCLGLTATPFRLGSGYIYGEDDETIFDDCIIDLTYMEEFNQLVDDGYLCDLRTMATNSEYDVSGIRTTAGDFNDKDMSDKFDRKDITRKIIDEVIQKATSFNKWLLFAIDIEHAEHITECLIANGINAYIVHSKMKESERDKVIQMFKSGSLRAIVNINILTTGFDAPDIDLIVLLRPTKSPVVHVQSIGRGLRPYPGKNYTMVLDFAGNTERLGPINDVRVAKKRKSKIENVDPITKRCPKCNAIHHPSVRVCSTCGFKFEFKSDLRLGSTDAPIIAKNHTSWYEVQDITYNLHRKSHSPNSIKVTYQCGLRFFREWICIEHEGYAGAKAIKWVINRTGYTNGFISLLNANELLDMCNFGKLKSPLKIKVDTSTKYPNIIEYIFEN